MHVARLVLFSTILLLMIEISWLYGHAEGFIMGLREGHADNIIKHGSCELRHNGDLQ